MSHFPGRTLCIVSDIMRYIDGLTTSWGLASTSKSHPNHFSTQQPNNPATMSANQEFCNAGEASESYAIAIQELRAKTEE